MGPHLSSINKRIHPFKEDIFVENNFTNILIEHNPSINNNDTGSDTGSDTVYNNIYNPVSNIISNTVSHTRFDIKVIKKNNIDKLPTEIVEKIYREYLEPELFYIRYKEIIEHPTSMSLNGEYLIAFIPIILAKPLVCKYISIKCEKFNKSYTTHKINNKKIFKLMSKGESFAATILFSLYH